ncbi:MAG TPA: glycosyltransferase family A protein [Solirubrobacteraceae bacterium]|jgi:glycosyltransferase involved in cell wall biosynthesis
MRAGVIVPVHGWAPYLAEALDSVLVEGPAAVVVVDDGSSPPLELHPDHAGSCALVRRDARGGPARARATGLDSLPRDIAAVALCDADDAWRPGFLARAVSGLADADVAVGRPEIVGPDNRPTGERWPALPPGPFTPSYEHNFVATPAVVLRREALERAGGFAAGELMRAEDWDLWLRLRAAGARFVSVPEAVVAVRRRAGALTADVAALAQAQLVLHERHAALVSERERARAHDTDLRALAAGLVRERRFAEARAALREAGADPLRRALLTIPLARRALGRRDPYRR